MNKVDNKEFLNEYTNKEYSEDFSLLDLEFINERFSLVNTKVVGDRLYIVSQRDEWYVDNTKGYLVLYHKNKRNITKRYHREDRRFANIFSLLGYIDRHDDFIFNENYQNRRLDMLFNQIAEG